MLSFFLASTPVGAAEKIIGKACTGDSNAFDWDTNAQCNGTTFVKGPLILGAVAAPPYAATACDASKAGMLQYTASTFRFATAPPGHH